MKTRLSKEEIFEKVGNISDSDIKLLNAILEHDAFAINILIKEEGFLKKFKQEITAIEIFFLKKFSKTQSDSYNAFKHYYKTKPSTWNFLSKEQKSILDQIQSEYRLYLRSYFQDRGDLIIFRKSIFYFIQERKSHGEDYSFLTKFLTNYSYKESLLGLGLNPEIDTDGLSKLNAISFL